MSPAKRSFLGPAMLGAGLMLAWNYFAQQEAVLANEAFVGGTHQGRELKVARFAGGDKALKMRINGVAKTGKITDAMRVVSAAKVRKSQDGVEKARPFSDELQSMIKGLVKRLKGSGLESELPMLRVPEKVKNVGILMITADKGLCGPYNSFAIKGTRKRIQDLNDQGIIPQLMIVGKKGVGALTTRMDNVKFNYTGQYFEMPKDITSKDASNIGDAIRNWFLSGEVDKIEVSYNKFINLLSNEATIRTLLPLSPTGIEDPEDETFKMTSEEGKLKVEKTKVKSPKAKEIEADVIFDQAPETILNSMLPLYLNSQLLSIIFDASASELSSRMTAMKTATDNAKDIVDSLTMKYNKQRQASITAEISEISAGASALDDAADKSFGAPLGMFDNAETTYDDFMQELEDGSIPDTPPMPDGPSERPEFDVNANPRIQWPI
eukprot:TRINITY_DN2236_c0_g1_i1.p1 TRINITY_DN2236_c0_g1~~TRINITY_DN2236_c0_g1_i1.p1  ORF type:complete len:452 (+),score=112.80 TRINITY_DN2236_c0_g1_i1:47-1357(+)